MVTWCSRARQNQLSPLLYGRHPVSRYDGSVFVETSTEKPVTKDEVQKRHTTPIPRFAKRPSVGNSNSPPEGLHSQNHIIDPRLLLSEHHFGKFPTPSTFSCWKIRFKTQVSACSGSSTEAMLWIKEVEMVDSVEDLKSSQSVASILIGQTLRCWTRGLHLL